MRSKDNLRKLAKDHLKDISGKPGKSKAACDRVFNFIKNGQINSVGLYADIGSELRTHRLHFMLEDKMMNIFYPKIYQDEVYFCREFDRANLKIGEFSFPVSNSSNYTEANRLDLIIVPGLFFDKSGNRLGRGMGHYDKTLGKVDSDIHSDTIIAGMCYGSQLLNRGEIPVEEHDIKMDVIFTENNLTICKK